MHILGIIVVALIVVSFADHDPGTAGGLARGAVDLSVLAALLAAIGALVLGAMLVMGAL